MKSFPAIFISHSSAADDDQAALLGAIKDTFSNDFEILLDQDLLRAGDLWRDELHTWMALCQAAIVILSPGVVANKKWVLKEFTILAWRQSLDESFVLIPVLLPSVSRRDFEKDEFSPLLVGEIQMARGDTATIVTELKTKFAKLQEREPTHVAKLIENIAGKLKNLSLKQCQGAAVALNGERLPWDSRLKHNEQLARRTVHADFAKLCKVVIDLSPTIGGGAASEILEWLFTFWIDPEAVVSIPGVVTGPSRAIALNASYPRTGRLYVRRAFCNYPPGSVEAEINSDGGELPIDDVEKQLRDFFRRSNKDMMRVNEALMQRQLETIGGNMRGTPVFVIISQTLPPKDLLALQGKYPRFTFVLTTGGKLPADDYYPSGSIRLLRPVLDAEKENDCYSLMTETQANINPPP